jgi:hypothetical protein
MHDGNGCEPGEVEWLPNHTARMVDPAWSGPSPDAKLSFVLVKTGPWPLAGVDIADALEAAAHEIREALTAAQFFTAGSKRALRLIRPDHVLCDQGLTRATEQLVRATRTARLIRQLSEQLGGRISATGPRSCERISNESGTWKDSNQAGNCK